jgi:hypothetical protein
MLLESLLWSGSGERTAGGEYFLGFFVISVRFHFFLSYDEVAEEFQPQITSRSGTSRCSLLRLHPSNLIIGLSFCSSKTDIDVIWCNINGSSVHESQPSLLQGAFLFHSRNGRPNSMRMQNYS